MQKFRMFSGAATALLLYKLEGRGTREIQLTVNCQLITAAQTNPVFKGFLAIFFGNSHSNRNISISL